MWHVAAHEIGHAIYSLDGVKNVIKTSTKTLLEEPRAELTALHTMTLLEPAGLLSKVRCQQTPLPWLLSLAVLSRLTSFYISVRPDGPDLPQKPTGAHEATGWRRLG